MKLFKSTLLIKNALYNSGSFFLISLVSFVTLPFFIGKLGVERYGIYVLVTSLLGYYGIFDLGLGQGLIKFVSERLNTTKQEEMIPGVVSAFWVQVLIGFVISFALFWSSAGISRLLNVGEANVEQTSAVIRIAAIGFFFSMVSAVFSSILMGMQLYHITSKIDAINNILLNVVSLGILYLSPDFGLRQLIYLNVASAFIVMFLYGFIVKKRMKDLHFRFQIDLRLLKVFFKFSVHIFLSKISGLFSQYIIKFLLSVFVGPSAVTYYTVPSKLLGALGGMLSSASNTIMPYVSSLEAKQDHDKIKHTLLTASFIFSAVAIPVILFCAIYSQPILELWMGRTFASNSSKVLTIICISSAIASFSTIPNQVVVGTGNSKLLGYFSIITVIVYLIFLPVLTKFYLLIGAVYGLLITSALVISVVIRKTTAYLEVPTGLYFSHVIGVHIVPVVLFALSGYLIVHFSGAGMIVELVAGGTLTAVYYLYLFLSQKELFLKYIGIK